MSRRLRLFVPPALCLVMCLGWPTPERALSATEGKAAREKDVEGVPTRAFPWAKARDDRGEEALLRQASVNGKYNMLLRSITVPADEGSYGQFNDWGHWTGTSWGGHDNLPPGHWVYLAPNWYIWGQQVEK